jgi:hypothetical protein
MKVLILGARGAVGAAAAASLRARGHQVTAASRRPGPDGFAVDLGEPDGLARLAAEATGYDAVVNASGIEDPGLGGLPVRAVVDVSATGSYLEALREQSWRNETATTVLGAGLAPGLSTLLLAALASENGDDLDLGVCLGTGDAHGAAAVEWTAGLIGTPVHEPPEGHPVRNLQERRRLVDARGDRRTFLRADFPDHMLIGDPDRVRIRSYLALTSRLATTGLALAGRVGLSSLVKASPKLGSDAWHLVAENRRTGERRGAEGRDQSRATGVLTALAAEQALTARRGPVTMADLTTVDEALARLRDEA